MIQKHMIGRLGNQMFQYAAIRAFQLKYRPNDKILLDFSEVYERDSVGYREELSDFNISEIVKGKLKMNFFQKILNNFLNFNKFLLYLFNGFKFNLKYNQKLYNFEKKIQNLINKFGLYSFRLGYFSFKNSKSKNISFYGTFESSKYFQDIKQVLQNEFTPKYGILKKNEEMYNKIKKSNSVCITIRRGDFISNKEYKKNLYVCDEKYFKKAIDIIQNKVDDPVFFVFSDDIEWCKNNMKFPKNTYFESGNDPIWEKLRMMYSCKNFIISNSTFSWWAQYLSRNDDKVVIAPSRWGNLEYKGKNIKIDIYDDNWILIDV